MGSPGHKRATGKGTTCPLPIIINEARGWGPGAKQDTGRGDRCAPPIIKMWPQGMGQASYMEGATCPATKKIK